MQLSRQFWTSGAFIFAAVCAIFVLLANVPISQINLPRFFFYPIIVVAVAMVVSAPVERFVRKTRSATTIGIIAVSYSVLIFGFRFAAAIIDQNYLLTQANWFGAVCFESGIWALELALPLTGFVAAEFLLHPRQDVQIRDEAMFPTVPGVTKAILLVRGRLILIVGFLVLLGDAINNGIRGWSKYPLFWTSDPAFASCIIGWCLLWIADASCRQSRSALWVPIVFLLYGLFALPAVNVIIE